jgi:hypothetical protein
MTRMAGRDRRIAQTASRWALCAGLTVAVAACQMAPGGTETPYVRTSSGGDVRSSAPPGIEVFLGSKQVRPADAPAGEAPGG